MNTPKVSVVIPIFNMGRFLPQVLSSIIKQEYANVEVILVDNNSTDDTPAVVEKYRDVIARWLRETDNGQPDAVTKGLKQATGDICHWHAADDIVLPGAFRRVVSEFQEHPNVDLVFSDNIGFSDYKVWNGAHVRWTTFWDAFLFGGRFQSDCAYWRSDITEQGLPLDNGQPLTCDEDFFLRLWVHREFRWVAQKLGGFRSHGRQVSQTIDRSCLGRDRAATRRSVAEQLGLSASALEALRKHHRPHWLFNQFASKAYSGGRFLHRTLTGGGERQRYREWLFTDWLTPLR